MSTKPNINIETGVATFPPGFNKRNFYGRQFHGRRPMSEEKKLKISIALKGRPKSETTKQKTRESWTSRQLKETNSPKCPRCGQSNNAVRSGFTWSQRHEREVIWSCRNCHMRWAEGIIKRKLEREQVKLAKEHEKERRKEMYGKGEIDNKLSLFIIFGEMLNYNITNSTIKVALETQLTFRERLILEHRFVKYPMSLRDIGKIYFNGITGEAVRHTESRALRKLRQYFYQEAKELEERAREKKKAKEYATNVPYAKTNGTEEIALSESKLLFYPETSSVTLIDMLVLSVRSRNCLRHANVSTIDELTNRTEQELMAIRNFGEKSKQEIISYLKTMELSLAL